MSTHDIFKSIKKKTYVKIENPFYFQANVYKTPLNYIIVVKETDDTIYILTRSKNNQIIKMDNQLKEKEEFIKIYDTNKDTPSKFHNLLKNIEKSFFIENKENIIKYFSKHIIISNNSNIDAIHIGEDGVLFYHKYSKIDCKTEDLEPSFKTLIDLLNKNKNMFFVEDNKIIELNYIPIDRTMSMHEIMEIKEI